MFVAIGLLTAMVGIVLINSKESLMIELSILFVGLIMLLSIFYTVKFISKTGISVIDKGEQLSLYVLMVMIFSIVVIDVGYVDWLLVVVMIFICKVLIKSQ